MAYSRARCHVAREPERCGEILLRQGLPEDVTDVLARLSGRSQQPLGVSDAASPKRQEPADVGQACGNRRSFRVAGQAREQGRAGVEQLGGHLAELDLHRVLGDGQEPLEPARLRGSAKLGDDLGNRLRHVGRVTGP